jgi:hypothetical protein
MERFRLRKMLSLVGSICYVGFINSIAVVGDMGDGALHREDEVTVKQRNQNLVMGPIGGPAPRRTGRQTVGRNVT